MFRTDRRRCDRRVQYAFRIFGAEALEPSGSCSDLDAQRVYAALTEQSDILHSYIVPEYDVLHTQSKDYIVDDILQVMRERGVTV